MTKMSGSLVTLASGPREETRAAARKVFHELMAREKRVVAAGLSLRALKEVFLDHVERTCRPLTYEFYRRHCLGFWKHAGTIDAAEVRPLHVTAWVAGRNWGPTTCHGAITAVKRMFRWAKREGHLEVNPLADMEKPTPRRRETILSDEDVARVMDAVKDRPFRELLQFVRETGSRPSEAMGVEAKHVSVDRSEIVMESKTGRRVIHLTRAALALCLDLAGRWPDGPLLRNTDGNPWTRNATACRFGRLRSKLGLGPEATMESFRHEWITDGLAAGVPAKTMAELAGHSSIAMIDRHYSHLGERREHLKEAVARVRPTGAGLTHGGTASRPAGGPGSEPEA